jgi:glucose-6-phosphate isomerase
MSSTTPSNHPAWKRLGRLATARVGAPPEVHALTIDVAGLHIDYSKQHLDPEVLDALIALSREVGINKARDEMFSGEAINVTEDRPALHTALRASAEDQPLAVRDEISTAQARQQRLVSALRDGTWRGYTGKPIRTLVHVGIGGSHLGPALVIEALRTIARSHEPTQEPIDCRFLANVDAHATNTLLDGLDPETTLFVIASKSFTTTETLVNATTLRAWFLERALDIGAIAQHFMAITANETAATDFGIPTQNVLPMWDWVGGRYSLWSCVGFPVAVSIGNEGFAALLGGARQLDQHFRSANEVENAPLLMALSGIWNSNFRGAQSHAVLCYDQRLAGLVTYLQQLEMESNGKTVRRDGTRTDVHTSPILWGGEETNSQHAFHQLLHQGSRAFSADFIACVEPGHARASQPRLDQHHRWLLANCLGQSEALLAGQARGPVHQQSAGARTSTTILLDRLDAATLGALIALYEHKVFCQGMIWDINPFDQWGVEFGKQLGNTIHTELAGGTSKQHDSATQLLMDRIRHGGSTEQR